ncbi:MAG: molybdopterin-dependent oxidoreductase [Alphaproteobacteria bacterium]|nr:molybdopterin-dependent oxidoreductase [Alphaproteobacteria bacterium]
MVDDDERLVRGGGRFIDDRAPAGALRLAVLRAPFAHGRITRLETAAAATMPGVRAVLTARDLAERGVAALATRAPLDDTDDGRFFAPPRPILADGVVRHVGEAVAAVVADDVATAADALEAIDLDIEAWPAVVDPEAARAAGAIRAEAPDNVAFRWSKGDADAAAGAMARAAHVVELTVRHPRVAAAPLEPRGALASYARETGRYTLWTPSQGVVALRAAMAQALAVDTDAVRIVTEDVGGSFAVKIWPYPEQVLALVAAERTGRPVKWVADRAESFAADVPGRARVDRARLALDADGRFLAFAVDALADIGAYVNTVAPAIVTTGATRVMGHVYRIAHLHYAVTATFTNGPPTDAYRGAGKPETVATLERLIDVAAARLGLDRFELRRRNLITPEALPYRTGMGETIDGGDLPALAARLDEAADLAGFAERRAASAARGRRRGLGLTFHLHATGGSTDERSEVRVRPEGAVVVRSGTQDSGQGHRRALAAVAAEVLDLPRERVRVEQGDSDRLAVGGGTGGSNLMPVAANTVHRTAHALLGQARARAAEVLEVASADLAYAGGRFRIKGTDRGVGLFELAAMGAARDDAPACIAERDFEGEHSTYPAGGYAVEVELDPETGAVRVERWCGLDDIGRVIDPPGAFGQLAGGVTQALGEALGEALVYDANGQLLTGSFMDYWMPRAGDVPAFVLDFAPTPSPNSRLGVKGVGEVGSIGGVAAVVNAVHDALRPFGVEHVDRPLTPAKLWAAIAARDREAEVGG